MELLLLTLLAACWALVGTGAVTSLVGWSAARAGGRCRDLEGEWDRYAWSKRYRFERASGEWPHARTPRVQGKLGDVEVVIEACTMTVRGAPRPCTRVWARALVPVPSRVLAASDARLLQGPGVHDLAAIETGDAFFDRVIRVRASSAEAARRALDEGVRRDMQRFLTSTYRLAAVLQVDDGDVSLTWLGEETRPAMLDEACALVVRACAAPSAGDAYRGSAL